ncbi:spermatogenesis-associated protein 31D1 [Oryctolagus cuniculus]|uniref:spermatogenesis-associated protein 31D1 n=1 Tax=Oryctolagus cuniculus TaxID=9986 RepID=UPI003879FB95
MEYVLSFLKSHFELWQSCSSIFIDSNLNYTLISGLGLIFLYLSCLVLKLFFTTIWKTKTIEKCWGRAKRRWKGGTFRGSRINQKEAEEGWKLLSVLKRPQSQHQDIPSFRHLLCPDPHCTVCNRVAAKVSRLLSLGKLIDDTSSVHYMASSASVIKTSLTVTSGHSKTCPRGQKSASLRVPSPPPPSTVSLNHGASLPGLLSPEPPADSVPPEPIPPLASKLPVDPFPPQPVSICPPTPHQSQRSDHDLHPEFPLSVMNSPDGLSTDIPTVSETDHSMPESSWQQAQVKDAKDLSSSNLEQDSIKHELDGQSSDTSCTEHASNLVEPTNFSLLSHDDLALLEKQVRKRGDFLIQKERENKMEPFIKQLSSDHQLSTSEKMIESSADRHDSAVSADHQLYIAEPKLESDADKHDSAVSLYFGNSKGKPKELQMNQQPPSPRTSDNQLQEFWGLPSLHSESLCSIIHHSDDCPSTLVIFNGISKASTSQGSLGLSNFQPLILPEMQSQSSTKTVPQSQSQHATQAQSQSNLQSPIPMLPTSPDFQLRICGVCFHRPPNEAQCLMQSELHQLEYKVLQKEQEHLWGLPSMVQTSQEYLCPPPPNFSLGSQSSKIHVPISVIPGDYPLSSELRKKFEYHLRKRLIQHQWGLPRRVYESLTLINPERDVPEIYASKSFNRLKWISLLKEQSSNNLRNSESSQLPISCETSSEEFQSDNDEKDHQRHSPKNGPSDHLLSDPEGYSENSLESDSEKDQGSQKQINGASSVRNISLNTSQEVYFLGSGKQKMLEEHISSFFMRMKCGLPTRVLESIQIFSKREDSSSSLGHSYGSSQGSLSSGTHSKVMLSKSLGRSSTPLCRDKLKMRKSAPNLDHLPAAGVQIKDGRKSCLCITDKEIKKTGPDSGHSVVLVSASHDGIGPEPKDKTVSSSNKEERLQAPKVTTSECFPRFNKSREIFKAKELLALQSKSANALTTNKSGDSVAVDGKTKREETTLATEIPSPTSVSQDPKLSEFKNNLIKELKLKLENRDHSSVQKQSIDMAVASDNLISKTLKTHAQGVSNGKMAASQVMHVHMDNTPVSMEQHQEPWVPKHIFQNCWDQHVPPDSKRLSHLRPKTGELGEGDAGLGTPQPSRKSCPGQDRALKKMLGSRSSPASSVKDQPPPENLFQKQIKKFLQWICPNSTNKRQERFLGKGTSSPSTLQSHSKVNSRTASTGNTKTLQVKTDVGKVLDVKPGSSHGVRITCPQESRSSPTKPVKTLKAQLQAQADTVQGHPFNYTASSCKTKTTKSCSQEASLADQNYSLKNPLTKDRVRQPQKVVAFKDLPLSQRHLASMPNKEFLPHPNHTCRRQASQVSATTPTFSEGTVLGDLRLLFKHKMLLQHFQGGRFPSTK